MQNLATRSYGSPKDGCLVQPSGALHFTRLWALIVALIVASGKEACVRARSVTRR
jgi:hypothetical protein